MWLIALEALLLWAGHAVFGWSVFTFLPVILVAVTALAVHVGDSPDKVANYSEEWDKLYREAYFSVAKSNLPLLMTAFENSQLVHETEREALKLQAVGEAKDIHEAMRRLARKSQLFSHDERWLKAEIVDEEATWPSHVVNLKSRPIRLEYSANYAAIYDYLFQPQEAFHAALESAPELAGSDSRTE